MEYDDRERKWHNLQQEALEKRLVWLQEPSRLVVHSPSGSLLRCLSSAPALRLEEPCQVLQKIEIGRDGPAEHKMRCSLHWYAS